MDKKEQIRRVATGLIHRFAGENKFECKECKIYASACMEIAEFLVTHEREPVGTKDRFIACHYSNDSHKHIGILMVEPRKYEE